MRLTRLFASFFGATLLVLALLTLALRWYYGPGEMPARERQAFKIEYLTPEEAAALLGEDPTLFSRPEQIKLPDPDISGQDSDISEQISDIR